MQRKQEIGYERVAAQVNRVRKLYSRIGEPLPADIIIDLHRHLAPALEAVTMPRKGYGKRRTEAKSYIWRLHMRRLSVLLLVLLCCGMAARAEEIGPQVTQFVFEDEISIFYIPNEVLGEMPLDEVEDTQYIDEPAVIDDTLRRLFTDEQYADFLKQYREDGSAEATVHELSLRSVMNCELGTWLAERSVGNGWIAIHHTLVAHPEMYNEITAVKYRLRYEDGVLQRDYYGKAYIPNERTSLVHLDSKDVETVWQDGGLSVGIYVLADDCVAFIRVFDAEYANHAMYLDIGGQRIAVVSGADQEDGILYVCPLSRAEADAIRRGISVSLEPY